MTFSNTNNFETIVVGLGAMGSAALYQLSKRDNKVLGIDQFAPPHKMGSTHGDTRITRQAIGEGEEYVPLSLRSYEIWDELERKTGKKLLTITGGLIVGQDNGQSLHGKNNFLQTTIAAAEKFNIPHSVLSANELKKRFPQFRVADNSTGYYEDSAGFLSPESCIEAQLTLARQQGAQINLNETIQQLLPLANGGVEVRTNKGVYQTNKVVLAAGPWIVRFLPEYRDQLKVYRQALYWFDLQGDVTSYLPENFPIFIITGTDGDGIYGFPAIDGYQGGLKVAFEEYLNETTPEAVNRNISQDEVDRAYNKYISKYLPGLSNKCVKAVTCLYTVTPDSQFIIDTHPDHSQIIIASPCSGHGFKHSAAIGEALAELAAEGKSHFDLSAFSLSRFNKEL